MTKSTVSTIKDFSNVNEVFDKLLELGFFVNENHKDEQLADITDPTFAPLKSNEFWYSNGVIEVKIFKRMFGAYELCNYRGIKHKALEEIFSVAELSRA